MDSLNLALVELLDHLGRRSAVKAVPAPRRHDRVGDWCSLGAPEEAHLRAYLDRAYPGWLERACRGDDDAFYRLRFEELVKRLLTSR